jgi:hypothetical protein
MSNTVRYTALLWVCLPLVAWAQAGTEQVGATDDGGLTGASTHQCPGHQILIRQISLQNSVQKYGFQYSGCQDPSHQGEHPSSEGNFGMPSPSVCNWYHSGFLTIDINGKDVVRQDVREMRITETGARGGFQVIWSHPDAEVSLRMILLPGQNHVLGMLKWQPRAGATLKNVTVKLRCYPSFFTAAHQRKGERHVKTPRTDQQEPTILDLVPGQDPWLLYYDTVFDVAKGEGAGPCAAIVEPAALEGGKVQIGDYAVNTDLNAKPEAGSLRFGLYDLTGSTNAEAEAYLQAHGTEDLAQLLALDFRPGPVRDLDLAKLKADAAQLITDAADDGIALKPKVDAVLKQVEELSVKGQGGDWQAEGELAGVVQSSQDLFWRLKTFAVLNRQ